MNAQVVANQTKLSLLATHNLPNSVTFVYKNVEDLDYQSNSAKAMGRQTALGILVLVASTAAAPAPFTLPPYAEPCYDPEPSPCYPPAQTFIPPCPEPLSEPPCLETNNPPCPLPRPSQPADPNLPPPTPGGNGPIRVMISKSSIPEKLRSAGFQAVQVPGGTFYITHSPPVLIQPPSILVRPAPLRPITPAAITVQPPQQPPIVPPRIVIRPAPLPPITPPPICVRPPRPAPIQPKPVIVRPPKPAPIQPSPITVTQPQPSPINPPPIVVRQPTPPTVQPPTICIPTSAIFKGEPSIRYPVIPEPCSVPCPDPCSCPYCSSPCP
ncbi:unnamed protein product [Parnassius apollo]|uniref:(apollo) hypothetical protein n=1 Tax=Parnassius apollo TaxID=110799 RepID=A0A8S3W576_PARAO|nr:unnamed protein product [Parnassius apollo]